MRLIDADALPKCNGVFSAAVIESAIKNAPTIDAMPVTRCRECAWGRTVSESGEYVWCGKPFAPPWPSHVANWYCADGKRKEDAK